MEYKSFTIQNYRAISQPLIISLESNTLIPLIGINECGKTTILHAIFAFDYMNDNEYEGKHLQNIKNLYETITNDPLITAKIR